jgi:beta-glucanase (GH16 family)
MHNKSHRPSMTKITLTLIALQIIVVTTHAQSIDEQFNDGSLHNFIYGSTGVKDPFKWKAGVPSSIEPKTNVLLFTIDPADSAGPGRGPEIISKEYTRYGTYSARIKIPDVTKVQPNTGAVVGYFTYNMDSTQGLSEIDFEWLIADPHIIYIGTWTGFEGKLQRIGRTIRLNEGKIDYTIEKVNYNGNPTNLTGSQNKPESIPAMPGYNAAAGFYTYGFDWYADRLRWWMIDPATNKKIILWDYTGSKLGIPQNKTKYRMNFWHTNTWPVETNPKSTEKPLNPYQLEIDWMKYKP